MERATERKQADTAALIAIDKANYQQWLLTHNPDDFDESNSLTGDAYYDYIEELKAERRVLMQELQSPKKINELRSTLFDLEKQMVEGDPSIDVEIREAKQTITFMISETFDGSMGDDMMKFAEDEIVIQEKQIEDACRKRSKSPLDIWAQYPAARRNLLAEQQAVPERTQEIQSRVLEIEAKLPQYNTLDAIPKSGGQDGMTSSEWIWGISDWNNSVRRVEYFNQGDTDCLPRHQLNHGRGKKTTGISGGMKWAMDHQRVSSTTLSRTCTWTSNV
jgi:hypothetical protein